MDEITQRDPLAVRDLAWEARMIAEAEAEIVAGLPIPSSGVNEWIDSLSTATPLPLPQAPKRLE